MAREPKPVRFKRSAGMLCVAMFAATLAAAKDPPLEDRSSDSASSAPREKVAAGTRGAVISAELLRQPLPHKARQMLLKALRAANAGDHGVAIRLFEEALSRYPSSAAWTQSLLGVEYLKTEQPAAAVRSFDQAVLLLPHDAADRFNFGLALALVGQIERAERELSRAVELDPQNTRAKQLLDALVEHDRRQAGVTLTP